MQSRDIEYFLAVASIGRLREAAAECGVTQPALSKAVRRLEQEFGVEFFERSAKGMHLSAAGRMFLAHAQRLHADAQGAAQHVNEFRSAKAGLVRVGAANALLRQIVIPAMGALMEKRPGLRVRLVIEPAETLFAQLRQGQLDFAVTATYDAAPEGFKAMPIGRDVLVPVVRKRHPLKRVKNLQLADLSPYHWILTAQGSMTRATLDEAFLESGLPAPVVALEVGFMSFDLLRMVRDTDLISLCSRELLSQFAPHTLAALDLPRLSLSRTIQIVTRHQMVMMPLVESLVGEIRSAATAAEAEHAGETRP